MDRLGKYLWLFSMTLLVVNATSLVIVNAETIPKPSVPEFTIQSQTQANTTIIILTIKNQPFNAISQYPNGFFYNVAISVDGKNWNDLYHVEDASDWYPQQSNLSTTVLTYVAGETMYYPIDTSQGVGIIPESGQVAFRVQAMIGHRDRGAFQNGFMPYVLVGEESDWSDTQIISIEQSQNSPTPSPTVPELSWLVILPLLLFVFSVAMVLRHRKSTGIDRGL